MLLVFYSPLAITHNFKMPLQLIINKGKTIENFISLEGSALGASCRLLQT